jgi:hypothetical protein
MGRAMKIAAVASDHQPRHTGPASGEVGLILRAAAFAILRAAAFANCHLIQHSRSAAGLSSITMIHTSPRRSSRFTRAPALTPLGRHRLRC